MYARSRTSLLGVIRGGFACALLFLSVLSISSMHAASGQSWWAMELLVFARQPCISLSASFIRFIRSHVIHFFVSERTSVNRAAEAARGAKRLAGTRIVLFYRTALASCIPV